MCSAAALCFGLGRMSASPSGEPGQEELPVETPDSVAVVSEDSLSFDEADTGPIIEMVDAVLRSTNASKGSHKVKKILVIGDSMSGWMGERLNAYGEKNGFEVATVVWDGATITKMANSNGMSRIIKELNPDLIMMSLGMNELLEPNPQGRLQKPVDKILETVGDIPFVWIGPPSWPGKGEGPLLNNWLEQQLGSNRFYRSTALNLERQSPKNPHPTKVGISKWVDDVVKWIPANTIIELDSLSVPEAGKMSRGKVFIYKRMKESL